MSVIVLTNEEVRHLVPISAYVDAIEAAYIEFGAGRAVIQPRIDLYTESPADGQYCVFKTMVGTLAKDHAVALRINSGVISWTRRHGNLRKEKIPSAQGERWVGLLFIFDTLTGELRAILPDGEVQRRRVAATTAVAIRHLARADSQTVGLFGSGSQAEAALYAVSSVLPSCRIRIWSPNENHRRSLAERGQKDGLAAEAVDQPERAAKGVDIIVAATNALDAVVDWDWISPGTLLTCVKVQELGSEILRKADRIVVHTKELEPTNYVAGRGSEPLKDTDFVDRLFNATRGDGDASELLARIASTAPDLVDVVSRKVDARTREDERTVFLNPVGNGLQFVAIAKQLLDAAERHGTGQKLPSEWFSEDMHP